MKLFSIFSTCLVLTGLMGYTVFNPAQAAQPQITVQSYARHAGPNTVYTYRVTNHGPDRLFRFILGCDCRDGRDPPPMPEDEPQLVIFPINYVFRDDCGESSSCGDTSEDSYTAPTGWYGSVGHYEGTGFISFDFDTDTGSGISLLPGYSETFSIITPTKGDDFSFHPLGNAYFYEKNKRGYLTGHYSYWEDIPNGGNRVVSYPMELIDKTPPTLSITLNPATLWPPNNKPMLVNATITTSDDYDPEPEIKLESITSSETLADGDIQNAQSGTDDRDFYLAAKRAGNNQTGRIYTITYSATDASGNKATASATVAVQHDQGR